MQKPSQHPALPHAMPAPRARYTPPALEPIGEWQLTVAVSLPINNSNLLPLGDADASF